ncbi:MAG: nuclear transport factor 2 family protein [Fidelibacterota bacterium]|nr:MAG: nuclear transport factor 2 family protein [Candidatus Neomarinimicrobiota bacterium]
MSLKASYLLAAVILSLSLPACTILSKADVEAEKVEITKVVRNSIGWALDKDRELLFNCMAQDTNFFIYHPDSGSTIVGFEAFSKMVDRVFMNEAFKATSFDVRDMRITLSRSGDVAWYSAVLDDFGEWDGQPSAWINTRWTGVLEKRDGRWQITQMHFSFASG